MIGIFYSQIVESSSLVFVLFRESISHPYISFFHLLVNSFSVTSLSTFLKTPYLYYTGGRGGIKMASSVTRYKKIDHLQKLLNSRYRLTKSGYGE